MYDDRENNFEPCWLEADGAVFRALGHELTAADSARIVGYAGINSHAPRRRQAGLSQVKARRPRLPVDAAEWTPAAWPRIHARVFDRRLLRVAALMEWLGGHEWSFAALHMFKRIALALWDVTTWSPRLVAWFWRAHRKLAVALPVAIITLLGAWLFEASERYIRTASLMLQFIGVVAVIIGITSTFKEFRENYRAKWRAGFWDGVPRVLKERHKNTVVADAAIGSDDDTLTARATVATPTDVLPLDARIMQLEQRMREQGALLAQTREELAAHKRLTDERFSAESQERNSKFAEIRGDLKRLHVGGLDLSLAGAVYALIGTAISTFPCELSTLLRGLVDLGATCP